MTTWETYLQTNQERYLDELTAFLSIPSISSLPEHKEGQDHLEAGRSELRPHAGACLIPSSL